MPKGRPSSFTPQLAEHICEQLAAGKSLRNICAADNVPALSTVLRWVGENAVFQEQYARARERQADHFAEEIIAIADDGSRDTYTDADGVERTDHDVVQRARLRVDARKWFASKVAPKKYGDRIAHTGPDGEGPVQVSVVRFTDGEGK